MNKKLMRALAVVLATIAFVLQGPSPAYARYDARDAERDCGRAVERTLGYRETYDSEAKDQGHHDYRITGMVKARGDADKRYVCKIRHKEVVSVKVIDAKHHDGGSAHDDKVATAVGLGVLGLAVAAAIVSDGEDASRQPHRWEDRGGDPFDDYDQLREACSHELRRHLEADHGRVRRVRIEDSHLHHRNLKGEAHVKWRGGEEADLRFDCAFDRQGRIHDGTYHYVSR